jgi:hypothetical protein
MKNGMFKGVPMTTAAARVAMYADVSVDEDLARLKRSGNYYQFVDECLAECENVHDQAAWVEYATALAEHLGLEPKINQYTHFTRIEYYSEATGKWSRYAESMCAGTVVDCREHAKHWLRTDRFEFKPNLALATTYRIVVKKRGRPDPITEVKILF